MSFSEDVKRELGKRIGSQRHCKVAEIAALMFCSGNVSTDADGENLLYFETEHDYIANKCFTLLKKTYNIDFGVLSEGRLYRIEIDDAEIAEQILSSVKMTDANGHFNKGLTVSPILIRSSCCKRAYLRGMYVCCGSLSDPTKGYHLEFVCPNESLALQLVEVLADFEIEGKVVQRKKYHVVYIKDGSMIVTLLNVIEAHSSLMELENSRILKEMANTINRRVNCEVANGAKTIGAASKQIDDILFISEHQGLDVLPDALLEMAQVRLENPDVPLKDLGVYLTPPIGKSGVNHRLRKISEWADRLRSELM